MRGLIPNGDTADSRRRPIERDDVGVGAEQGGSIAHGARRDAGDSAEEDAAAGVDTGADPARVNPAGGAIALGHPIGATGARLMTTLLCGLERSGGRYGLQTMCEGGGQANVTIIERLTLGARQSNRKDRG